MSLLKAPDRGDVQTSEKQGKMANTFLPSIVNGTMGKIRLSAVAVMLASSPAYAENANTIAQILHDRLEASQCFPDLKPLQPNCKEIHSDRNSMLIKCSQSGENQIYQFKKINDKQTLFGTIGQYQILNTNGKYECTDFTAKEHAKTIREQLISSNAFGENLPEVLPNCNTHKTNSYTAIFCNSETHRQLWEQNAYNNGYTDYEVSHSPILTPGENEVIKKIILTPKGEISGCSSNNQDDVCTKTSRKIAKDAIKALTDCPFASDISPLSDNVLCSTNTIKVHHNQTNGEISFDTTVTCGERYQEQTYSFYSDSTRKDAMLQGKGGIIYKFSKQVVEEPLCTPADVK